MTENQINPDDITAYIQDNGLPKNNIDFANMVNFFAELIVRECITQCKKHDPSPDPYSDMDEYTERRTVNKCINSIEEHFGIE